ncbi:MAG TPA: hypothetical protein VFJ94_06300, partial [Intrasporangium sp.]|uniref:hypothetical protein n=1 Tax=Intrasporangium sp. TaxID=1925024 RepID=UPI002D79330B
ANEAFALFADGTLARVLITADPPWHRPPKAGPSMNVTRTVDGVRVGVVGAAILTGAATPTRQ